MKNSTANEIYHEFAARKDLLILLERMEPSVKQLIVYYFNRFIEFIIDNTAIIKLTVKIMKISIVCQECDLRTNWIKSCIWFIYGKVIAEKLKENKYEEVKGHIRWNVKSKFRIWNRKNHFENYHYLLTLCHSTVTERPVLTNLL